jgi:hypothetical protein
MGNFLITKNLALKKRLESSTTTNLGKICLEMIIKGLNPKSPTLKKSLESMLHRLLCYQAAQKARNMQFIVK